MEPLAARAAALVAAGVTSSAEVIRVCGLTPRTEKDLR
jgi:hypothetical protein